MVENVNDVRKSEITKLRCNKKEMWANCFLLITVLLALLVPVVTSAPILNGKKVKIDTPHMEDLIKRKDALLSNPTLKVGNIMVFDSKQTKEIMDLDGQMLKEAGDVITEDMLVSIYGTKRIKGRPYTEEENALRLKATENFLNKNMVFLDGLYTDLRIFLSPNEVKNIGGEHIVATNHKYLNSIYMYGSSKAIKGDFLTDEQKTELNLITNLSHELGHAFELIFREKGLSRDYFLFWKDIQNVYPEITQLKTKKNAKEIYKEVKKADNWGKGLSENFAEDFKLRLVGKPQGLVILKKTDYPKREEMNKVIDKWANKIKLLNKQETMELNPQIKDEVPERQAS